MNIKNIIEYSIKKLKMIALTRRKLKIYIYNDIQYYLK